MEKATGGRPTFSNAMGLKAFKPEAKPYLIRDTLQSGGYVEVAPSGTMSYRLIYRIAGTKKKVVLGRFAPEPAAIAAMRKRAKEYQLMIADGIDPAKAKQQAKVELKASLAKKKDDHDKVELVVDDFIKLYVLPNNRNHKETVRILNKEIVGRWGSRRLSEISSVEVREAFREIAKRAPVGANRIFSHFRKLCNWAIENEIIATSPCERVKPVTSEKGRARERVLSDMELAIVYRAASTLSFPYGAITRLLILTGARRGEISALRWEEIDTTNAVIRLPAQRMKANVAHIIPMSDIVVETLSTAPRFDRKEGEVDFVFSQGTTPPSGFSKWKAGLDRAVRDIAEKEGATVAPFTLHDLRRTAASTMAALGVAPHIIEKVLAHTSGTFAGVAGVYNRYSFESETRDALNKLSAHVQEIVKKI